MTFKQFFYQVYLESKEVSNNIKNRTPQEIYKVAQDIRKNPGDYPDIQIAQMIAFKYNIIDKKHNDKETGYQPASTYYSDEAFIKNDSVYFIRIPLIFKVTTDQIKKFVSKQFNINIKDTDRLNDAFKMIVKFNRSVHDDNPIIGTAKLLLRDRHRSKDNFEELDEEDMRLLFQHYGITAPVIYNYLISSTYNLPKHPTDIPDAYRNLPRSLLNQMYDENLKPGFSPLTPLVLATDSSDITGGTTSNYVPEINYIGFSRILDADTKSEFSPTSKEAHNWLSLISETYKKYPESASNHYNFPSYIICKALKYTDEQILDDEAWNNIEWLFGEDTDLSIQSWKVFRWFTHNIRSKYFTKPQEIHGPAGTHDILTPIKKISQITDADLDNGIKTSVERAFNNAAQRIAKEFDDANTQAEFNYNRIYQDTPYAKVIKNKNALHKEGERMNHCVGSYGQSCLSGRSLIIQLPNSTAELDPRTLKQYQHFGKSNTEPPEIDKKYLAEWIKINSA